MNKERNESLTRSYKYARMFNAKYLRCKDVASEQVFANLRKYKVDLEKLKISKTYKVNEKGSLHFQKYFTCQLGRRLRVLDISGGLF